jgi:hypothetical protein
MMPCLLSANRPQMPGQRSLIERRGATRLAIANRSGSHNDVAPDAQFGHDSPLTTGPETGLVEIYSRAAESFLGATSR